MALYNPPTQVNGIPLSPRSRDLLYAPLPFLMPMVFHRFWEEQPKLFAQFNPLLADALPPSYRLRAFRATIAGSPTHD